MLDKSTVFYCIIERSPVVILSFIETKTQCAVPNGIAIADIPDTLVAIPHPDGSDSNAWTVKPGTADFLITAILRKAGFLDETSIQTLMTQLGISYDPNTGPRSGHLTGVTIHPDGYAIVSGNIPRNRPIFDTKKQFKEFSAVRFTAKERKENTPRHGAVNTVRVRIDVFQEGEWGQAIEDRVTYTDMPSFLVEEGSLYYLSTLSLEETKNALTALGWTENPDAFMWYDPEHLVFYVDYDTMNYDEEDVVNGAKPLYVVVFPKEKTPWSEASPYGQNYNPFEDDLRGDQLGNEPIFFDGDTMENTFAIKPGYTKETVKAAMIAAGYTYDESLGEHYG